MQNNLSCLILQSFHLYTKLNVKCLYPFLQILITTDGTRPQMSEFIIFIFLSYEN